MEDFVKVLLNLALVNYVAGSPQISLEYNPYPLPSYNPNPGQNTAHTVPPGKPWPASAEDYNSFSQTSSVRPLAPSNPTTVENRFQETTTPKKETSRPNLDYGKPPASLEYNPYPLPSFKPNPGQNTAHTVPPGKPWPANAEDYNSFSQTSSPRPKPMVENRFQETTTTTRPNLDYCKPPASLEYNPYPLPSYNPNPGGNTALTIPPGKPWPANPPTSETNQSLNNRIQEAFLVYPEDLWFVYLSDRFREMISNTGAKETFVLDYKPSRPNPAEIEPVENPAIIGQNQNPQVVEEDRDQVQPLIVLDHKPNPPFYRPRPSELPPGEPWPVNPEDQNVKNRVGPVPDQIPPLVVLDYKPNRPFYRPSPTEIQQIIPPGQPWPAKLEDYASFGQSRPQEIENRFQEEPPEQVQPLIVLDYKPNRPFYRPSPTEIQQIVPPGKPWPANQEDYATFSEDSSANPSQSNQQKEQNLENRLQETTSAPAEQQVEPLIVLDYKPNRPFYRPSPTEVQQVVPPGKPWPATPTQQTIENRFEEITTPTSTPKQEGTKPQLVLDYKPSRPSFHPNPGGVIGQLVPPGKPLPATPTQQTSAEVTTLKQENELIGTKPRPNPDSLSGQGVPSPVDHNRPQTVLEYYPVSTINQGSSIGQIVRPGKPWPANAEDYNSSNLRVTQDIVGTKTEGAQPTAKDSQPMTEGFQPTTESSQPMTESSQPITEGSQPMTKDSPSTTEETQPMAKASQPTTEDMSESMLFTSKLSEEDLPTLSPM